MSFPASIIPALSARAFAEIPLDASVSFDLLKAGFDAFDQTVAGRNDPSRCKALVRLSSGAIFWSSKLAVDADGTSAGPLLPVGTELDPSSGQNDTSFHFDDGRPLSSAAHPYIVLPLGSFREATGLVLGDVAAIIYRDKLTAAICGDLGPHSKLGEGSINLHEAFHDPCSRRDGAGNCLRIRDVSIEEDVLFTVFPGSGLTGLTFDNAGELIRAKAYELFASLGGRMPA